MNIKTRIWSLPALAVLIFSLGITIASYFSNRALGTIERTGAIDYITLNQSTTLRSDVQVLAEEFKNAVMEGDKKRLGAIDEHAAKLKARMDEFAALPGQDVDGMRLSQEFASYAAQARSTARVMLEIDQGDAGTEIAAMQKAFKTLEADLDGAIEKAKLQFAEGIAASADGVRQVLIVTIGAAALVILVLVVVAHFVIRAIWQQLGGEPEYAANIARGVAAGDLSTDIIFDQRQPGSLLAALSEMKERLAGIVAGIQGAAAEIRLASSEIATGNADLSSRTEAQANNLGNAAQSMAEMTAEVQKNADSAHHASGLAGEASGVAVKGGNAVQQVVATMEDISSSARKIVEIIAVIDGIAFQTNILALNAAVEAARAGEQGRGFAVVASEVRNLAQRSASAAKEIKELIVDSVNKVDLGSVLVRNAGDTMTEIVTAVQQVSTLIGEISHSSHAQSKGLEALNATVNDMDASTQRNAAMTEEAAAAADSLQEQVIALTRAVGVFRLKQADERATAGSSQSSNVRQRPALALLRPLPQ